LAQPEITDAPASIEDVLNSDFELSIYPNPSQDQVQITFSALQIEPYEIILIDASGTVVVQKRGMTNNGENHVELQIENLPSAAYHFLVKVGKSTANQGFIKID